MSYKYTDFVFLAKNRPDLARERFLDALVEASGQVAKAWRILGLSAFSWYRYVKILDIKEEIDSLRLAYSETARRASFRYSDHAQAHAPS